LCFASDIEDANGKFIVREIMKVARDSGAGWVEYRWLNPATKEIGPKESYVRRVPDTDLVVYVGVYR
jgi:signal transduction histidine kinase